MSLIVTTLLPSLLLFSLVFGVAVLLVFKYTSNQKAIRRARNRVQAYLLEIRLFPEDPRTTVKAIGHLFVWNMKVVAWSLPPMLILAAPTVWVLFHMDHYYGLRPLKPGEAAVVSVEGPGDATLNAPAGIVVETPAVRSLTDGEVSWRIRAQREGVHHVTIVGDDGVERTRTIAVGGRAKHVEPNRDHVAVAYPRRYGGVHWLTVFLIASLLGAFALRRPLGVVI